LVAVKFYKCGNGSGSGMAEYRTATAVKELQNSVAEAVAVAKFGISKKIKRTQKTVILNIIASLLKL